MKADSITYFKDEKGNVYNVGDTVTITWNNGGGNGSCKITKITKTGFRFRQVPGREKSAQFDNIRELTLHNNERQQ
jgi:hypothetical protein